MKSKQQPAKISYFFGPGWKDIGSFIKKLWIKNAESSKEYDELYREYGLMSFKGIFRLMCSLSIVMYGTIMFIAISSVYAVVLSIFFVLVYIGFSIVWGIDRLYLKRKKIFTACPECKEKSLIPTYACPDCGEKHTNLTPGKYGILNRKCNCGRIIPTTFMNGRKNLEGFCQSCGHPLADRENVPICIPIVGGRSVGKTAFITAFSRDFIKKVAPNKKWEVEIYDNEKAEIYNEIEKDYINGTTRMTDRPQDIRKASSISFSFFIRGEYFKPERLVHIYDIAGEVFTHSGENEIQKQYEYCQGIVLMIDPFSIPSVRYNYENELQPEDIAGIGKANINEIVDSFLNKLREVTGLSANKMSTVPLAIVISKVDTQGLKREIGKEAVQALLNEKSDIFKHSMDAEDFLCRQFLSDNGMESFISSVDIKFKTNRYFACSSIGHTREKGAYAPEGIMEPMEWLFRKADATMDKYWKDNTYSKVPIVVKTPV